MAQDQKQKVLIAILAVLALGAGSYYFFLRDSGNSTQAVVNTGPAQRRERAKTDDSKKTLRREAKTPAATTERAAPERREREEVKAPEASRRAKTREKTEVKKKKIAPAG